MSDIEARLNDLIDQAEVELVETGKVGHHLNAAYHSGSGRIYVRWGLDPVTRRCAIAHELGHFHNGDSCSNPSAERLADEWAALNLIHLDDVENAAESCEGQACAIAAEIGVTPQLLEIWMTLWKAGRIPVTWSCLH